jgi:DNA-binding response OmpR family regulator
MKDLKVVLVGPTTGQLSFVYDALLSRIPDLVCYSSGDEALLNLHDDEPGVIIVDMDSPKVDSPSFCAAIKSNPKYSEVPIVLLSTGPSIGDLNLYFKGIDFMKKPFNNIELLARINLYRTLRTMCATLKPYTKGA